jgi:hypothetical protein
MSDSRNKIAAAVKIAIAMIFCVYLSSAYIFVAAL